MKKSSVTVWLTTSILLLCFQCKTSSKTPTDINEALIGTWYHSFEEDSADVKCFRKEGYRFPASRGRNGMVFLEKGGFQQINIGVADGEERIKGSWKLVKDDVLDIHLYQDKKYSYKVKLKEITKNKLRWQVVPHP